jgi:SAM-dependent methyltransferase
VEYSVRTTYRALAPIYDQLTAENNYEMWLGGVLLPELEKHGLRQGAALDVGCGTGRAFEPLLDRGWVVRGCDLSAEMLEEARRKFGDAVEVEQADLRALPVFGQFDLALALNDVVNYLVEDGDLVKAFAGIRANLAPGGLLVFDANTLGLFRGNFASGHEEPIGSGDWRWVGASEIIEPGGIFDAQICGPGISPQPHRERHHTGEQVREAMERAGLELLATLGQWEVDGQVFLDDAPDELRHLKTIYVGRAAR